ncbi:MAG: hypothetical protein HYX27_12645 [Acidobacteria bacterium]|nr:hypothetical protein [Acidobacteriota bacterium]
MLVLATTVAVCVPALAQEASPSWPNTYVSRLQALALLQTLNAEVLGSRSATLTLERWCREHQLTDEPIVIARVVKGVAKAPNVEQIQRLQVNGAEEVKYRRVQLRCGNRLLSEAENWYVPARLTAEMNRLLETTDTPFGRVVQDLEPYRQTFGVKILWSPLPNGWERNGARPAENGNDALSMPDALFEHRAVLYTRGHKPFAEVNEVYQRELLAFPAPTERFSSR